MPNMIRPATLDDIAQIASVFIEARTKCLAFLNWDYDHAVMCEVMPKKMAGNQTLVTESEGQVVGFIIFNPTEIEDLYVCPDFHGQGIGHRLLLSALQDAGDEVRLWVFQENRQARAFYERNGFEMEFETDGQDNMEKAPDARYLYRRK